MSTSHLQATNGHRHALRSFAWSGLPILDACSVQADYGQLLVVTSDGALYGIDLDKVASVKLCAVALPDIPRGDESDFFGVPALRLHASSDGKYAALVVDKGRQGLVVETLSGTVTMRLDGGDYYEHTVPFSACFLRFEGRNVLVHRTDWNRLEASDPATGELLTERYIAPYENGKPPEHYLDYFHGQLRASPDGSRILDDGWVWHPASVPRTWSVTAWLSSNPWESEDGDSIVDLALRDDWNGPACWIDDQHIAIWGLAGWVGEELSETGKGPGLRIFEASMERPSFVDLWPMGTSEMRVRDLSSDGQRLYVSGEAGTTVWDIDSRLQVIDLPGFTARLLDVKRATVISIEPAAIVELVLPWEADRAG